MIKKINLRYIYFLFLILTFSLHSAYLTDVSQELIQPDGTKIYCLASGDEYFNYLHDEDGYTIIQGDDGYYYYAVLDGEIIAPSSYRVDTVNPNDITSLKKGVQISREEYIKKVKFFTDNIPVTRDAPTTGTVNNISIFIRFSDEAESVFNFPRETYANDFSDVDGPSLIHYFKEVSFDTLTINTTHYPPTDGSGTCYSYQDSHPRAYFKPYSSTNPTGYNGSTEQRDREHQLLVDAVNGVSSQIPSSINIDANGDDNVDNISFTVSGDVGAWSSLLWPHRWSLYSQYVYINGKRVYDYLFMLGGSSYYTPGVLCHEFFHVLGAPDLYRYSGGSFSPAGPWDIMCSNSNPPQYPSAFMKYKYGDWIPSIPVISESGIYTLDKLGTEGGNVCYRINSPNSSNEYFVVEFRKQEGIYDSNLPGEGLLVWRINNSANGNAQGPPDEVYVYRVGGTTTINGTVNSANFSIETGRTEMNDNTSPNSFLGDGSDGGLNISEIGSSAGNTISFRLGDDPTTYTPIWEDDFETDKGWILSGEFERDTPQGLGGDYGNIDPTTAYEGSKVLGVDLTGLGANPGDYEPSLTDREYIAESPTIDCSGYFTIRLSFQQWLNVEQPSYDHAYIDYFNGSSWEEIYSNNGGVEDNSWNLRNIFLPTSADNNPNVKIRFTMGETDGSWQYSGWNIDNFVISAVTPSSISDNDLLPEKTLLLQNYPNPFNPITKINYELAITNYELAEIVVYNSAGQQVWSSPVTDLALGVTGSILFDGFKFNSGVYYYSLIIDGKKIDTKAMLLIK